MRLPALYLLTVLALAPFSLSQQESAAKPVLLAQPADIPVELGSELDMDLVKAGDVVQLKVTQDVRDAGQTVIPKDARLTAKVTLAKVHSPQPWSNSLAILVEQATWENKTVFLRGYIAGPFRSQRGASSLRAGGDLIGWPEFSPTYGSVVNFSEVAHSCDQQIEPGARSRCIKVVVPSDSKFLVRHLPEDYQLNLLQDEEGYKKVRTTARSAEEGAPEGEFTLAEMYRTGLYMVKADSKAFSWYARAAEHGHPTAQADLAVCYARGAGTPVDFAAAYKWLYISANSGVEGSKQPLHALEQRLSPFQIADAVAQAKAWMAQHPKKP